MSNFSYAQAWSNEPSTSAEVRGVPTLSKARNNAREPPPTLREARAKARREEQKRKREEKKEQELRDEQERKEQKRRKDEAETAAKAMAAEKKA
eukprot:6177099-Pleurochrysis_carterae.AAC.1